MNLLRLDTWDAESGTLNVVIETSKGSRNKLTYNPEQKLFELTKILPRGLVFPFDFGGSGEDSAMGTPRPTETV